MSNIKPTVGRMVYYKSYGTPNGEFPSIERAAIITDVRDSQVSQGAPEHYTVRLCVMNPEGLFFTNSLEQGERPGQWDWMPFQKDQQSRLGYETK